MRNVLLDLLFPPSSLTGERGSWMTPAERSALVAHPLLFESPLLVRKGMPGVDRLAAAASYGSAPLVREAVRRFKYRGAHAYGDALGAMAADASAFLPAWPAAVVCPVPLHWARRFLRGFNQAEFLAQHVALARGWRMDPLLARTRSTGSQAKRSRAERRRAIDGAIAWSGGPAPDRVVLVDDVVTSGATIDACAAVLRQAGVRRVDAVSVAVAFA
jgi:ComF family protein